MKIETPKVITPQFHLEDERVEEITPTESQRPQLPSSNTAVNFLMDSEEVEQQITKLFSVREF